MKSRKRSLDPAPQIRPEWAGAGVSHTPGPWEFRPHASSDADLVKLRELNMRPTPLVTNEGQRVVMSKPMSDSSYPDDARRIALVDAATRFKRGTSIYDMVCAERDANARLIAAAPTMLRALKAIRENMPRAAVTELGILDAAIKAAEGS